MLAFISPGYPLTRKEGAKETTFFAEKAGTDLAFDSVFVKGDHHWTGPRVPGDTELAEPVFPPGEEYRVKPTDQVLPVPRFSRRAKLAALATGGGNRAFNENLANRLWAMMMGRGLVYPVDMHHPDNPPSQPELMKLLGEELASLKFNARAFLRELALTRTYQHAIDLPAESLPVPSQFDAKLAEMKARSTTLEADAEHARDDYARAVKTWHQTEEALIPIVGEQDKALAKHSELAKKKEEAQKAAGDIQASIISTRETAKILAEAAARAQEAVKKLPKEKDLADAAGILVKRSKAAVAELAALDKASVEKSNAFKKAESDLAATTKVVETARSKVQPVRESVRQKEKLALESRRKMSESRTAMEEHRRRLGVLETYCAVASLCNSTRRKTAEDSSLVERPSTRPGSSPPVMRRRGNSTRMRPRPESSRATPPRRPGRTRKSHSNDTGRSRPASTRPSRRPKPRASNCPTIPTCPRRLRSSRPSRPNCNRSSPGSGRESRRPRRLSGRPARNSTRRTGPSRSRARR